MPARTVALFHFTDPWMQEMVRQVAPSGFDVRFPESADADRWLGQLESADFFVTMDLPAEWVARLRCCRLVQLQGVGYDGIDTVALAAAGIPLAATPEGTTVGVAEHTILLILALYKQLPAVHDSVRRGEFDRVVWRRSCHFFTGKTLGLVGFGRIGRRVAQLARPFDVTILYSDVARAPATFEAETGARFAAFAELLAESDVVSVHAPLTPETTVLFGADAFARMKPGALFINTARGGTYDMGALAAALRSGHLGGAGLDVYNPQPPPKDHPILQLPNVILTPHMATGTVEAHLDKARAQFANFQRVLRGEPPMNLVEAAAP